MTDRPIFLFSRQCSGCGACAEMRPDLFAFDEVEQRAVLKVERAPEQAVREAMAWCPCHCIEMGEEPDAGPES